MTALLGISGPEWFGYLLWLAALAATRWWAHSDPIARSDRRYARRHRI